MSTRELADRVAAAYPPFDRATLGRIERGDTVRESSIEKVERWLDAFEHETSTDLEDAQPTTERMVEFTITVEVGSIRTTAGAKGSPADAPLIQQQLGELAARVISEARTGEGD